MALKLKIKAAVELLVNKVQQMSGKCTPRLKTFYETLERKYNNGLAVPQFNWNHTLLFQRRQ
jgi:hypothetical protein